MKRYALLVEALIGLTLTATLLGALVAMTLQLNNVGRELDKEMEQVIASTLLQKRLTGILAEALLIDGGLFCSSDPGLVFTYNRGIDPDPLFSADLLARLYLKEKELLLATWPHPKRCFDKNPPCRTEVLKGSVERFSLQFYNPTTAPDRPAGWVGEWKQEWNDLPLMVRVTVDGQSVTIPLRHSGKLLIFL